MVNILKVAAPYLIAALIGVLGWGTIKSAWDGYQGQQATIKQQAEEIAEQQAIIDEKAKRVIEIEESEARYRAQLKKDREFTTVRERQHREKEATIDYYKDLLNQCRVATDSLRQ